MIRNRLNRTLGGSCHLPTFARQLHYFQDSVGPHLNGFHGNDRPGPDVCPGVAAAQGATDIPASYHIKGVGDVDSASLISRDDGIIEETKSWLQQYQKACGCACDNAKPLPDDPGCLPGLSRPEGPKDHDYDYLPRCPVFIAATWLIVAAAGSEPAASPVEWKLVTCVVGQCIYTDALEALTSELVLVQPHEECAADIPPQAQHSPRYLAQAHRKVHAPWRLDLVSLRNGATRMLSRDQSGPAYLGLRAIATHGDGALAMTTSRLLKFDSNWGLVVRRSSYYGTVGFGPHAADSQGNVYGMASVGSFDVEVDTTLPDRYVYGGAFRFTPAGAYEPLPIAPPREGEDSPRFAVDAADRLHVFAGKPIVHSLLEGNSWRTVGRIDAAAWRGIVLAAIPDGAGGFFLLWPAGRLGYAWLAGVARLDAQGAVTLGSNVPLRVDRNDQVRVRATADGAAIIAVQYGRQLEVSWWHPSDGWKRRLLSECELERTKDDDLRDIDVWVDGKDLILTALVNGPGCGCESGSAVYVLRSPIADFFAHPDTFVPSIKRYKQAKEHWKSGGW